MEKLKIAIIGFGRMGEMHLKALQADGRWHVKYICDVSEERRQAARQLSPESTIIADEMLALTDPDVQVIAACALADSRCEQITRAFEYGKHVVAEKPIAYRQADEWALTRKAEATDLLSTVNLYLRNARHTQAIREFICSGEIGELAIIRICHMTPGLAPSEGHEFEGPAFHDCGMHYVDLARWFADADFATWHAQGLRMWNWKEPWWLQVHGTFTNGVVYDITQGFVYGQLSKDQTHCSYIDIIGSKGIVRATHDFKTAVVDMHGTSITRRLELPYGEKNLDRLYSRVAGSLLSGRRDPALPTFRQAAEASRFAWNCLEDAAMHDLPAIGDLETLAEIVDRRAHMTNGYGLLRKRKPETLLINP